ncbi:acyl-CoA dehydrogenase family protein [Mycetocola zhadangensis]|uniref:acyl-CoA dehydrogenase family protein n=1 Tax=Mycetocola zhadangensis TaxID=1164595 RepID=UPI003A4E3DD8
MATETVTEFRLRARSWLAENMPKRVREAAQAETTDDDEVWARARELQKMLYKGGFAGICFPKEYGGLGLSREYQDVFTEESDVYEMPLVLNVPTLSICAPTIMDMASEELKREHLPAVIRGDEVLVQFLSEPSGGSNLAGVLTRADRDGDSWILNGSKIWSSNAYAADYALCLARTDWDAPKHRGLTMFLIKVHQPGLTVRRIEQVNGQTEFCEEFFDDVIIPASAVVGEINDGWTVATRQLFHERTAVGGGSEFVSGRGARGEYLPSLSELAREVGLENETWARDLVAKAAAHRTVQEQLIPYVISKVEDGSLPGIAMSLIRLFHAETDWLESDVGLELAGAVGVAHDSTTVPGQFARHYLMRQGASLGGGSSEMSRNIISERLLRMPREAADDKDIPFREVRQGR